MLTWHSKHARASCVGCSTGEAGDPAGVARGGRQHARCCWWVGGHEVQRGLELLPAWSVRGMVTVAERVLERIFNVHRIETILRVEIRNYLCS